MQENEVIVEVIGSAGVLTLNRPKALNALSLPMIETMTQALQQWHEDPSIQLVILRSNSDKAFCAGGDIRSVYHACHKGNTAYTDAIFRREYTLNYLIATYPKPYIALIDGIAMGGGLGISILGSYPIVTERAVLAMPETAIGFFPDVGAGYFLNRCPGSIGTYLGLTGARITAEDVLFSHLATYFVPCTKLQDLFRSLTQDHNPIDRILANFATHAPGESTLALNQALIDRCFSKESVEEILQVLANEPSDFAKSARQILTKNSPTSLKTSLMILKRAKNHSLKEVLKEDFRLSQNIIQTDDFLEGVRALLIDKDQQPNWQPQKIENVSISMIEAFFETLTDRELNL